MKNNYDEEDDYDYSPNELAYLAISNPEKHDKIVSSNLEEGNTVEKWEQCNLKQAQKWLNQQ